MEFRFPVLSMTIYQISACHSSKCVDNCRIIVHFKVSGEETLAHRYYIQNRLDSKDLWRKNPQVLWLLIDNPYLLIILTSNLGSYILRY